MKKRRHNVLAISTTAFFNDRGCHIRIENVLRSLATIYKKITLIAYAYGKDRNSIDIIRAFPEKIDNNDYIGFNYKKLILDYLVYRKACAYMKRNHCDLLVSFTHEAAIIAMLLSWRFKIPFVLDYQGSLSDEIRQYGRIFSVKILNDLIKRIEIYLELRSIAIIYNTQFNYCNSNKQRRLIIEDRYYPANEINITSFRENNEKIILWIGLLNNCQGKEILFNIIEEIAKKRNDIKFVIIGYPVNIKLMNEKYKNAVFTGKMNFEYLPSIIKDADLCISTKPDSSQGSHKLIMYKKYAKDILSIDSKASREILKECQIASNENELINAIMEKV